MTELLHGAATQARVVFALALRETRTRFGKNQLGYLWALLEPLFWILTFYGMFRIADRGSPGGMELIPFLTTGIIPYELAMKTSDRVALSIDANKALLFYPHVQPLDLIFARAGLEVATLITVFVTIVGAHALIIQEAPEVDILRVAEGLGLAGMFGMALGTVFCSLNVISNVVERIKGPLMRPLFWASGLFFSADALPAHVRDILLYNPILHCVEITREGWFPQYHARHANPSYVVGWIVVLAFVGLTLERGVRRKVELT